MKQILITLLVFISIANASAQEIYVSSLDDRLYRLDINTCSYDYLTTINREVFDITFHPNGNLYGISGNGRFFQIDTISGNTNQIHKFNGLYYNSLTASGDGIIYTTGSHRELWSYNLSTNTAKFHGNTGFKATGDLTFYDGNLYAAVAGNKIALIDIENPSNSYEVIQQSISGEIFGIVSYTDDCSEINSYAITNGQSDIYQIDFTTNSLNFICGLNIRIGGGASTFEFFASAPIKLNDILTTNPLCNLENGEIVIEATGGTGILQYSLDGINFYTTNTFLNLKGGQYTIYLKDDTGCILAEEVDLPEENAPKIDDVIIADPTCQESNGSIIINASGGTGMLEYSIDGLTFQTGNIFENLQDGSYNIIVMDSEACTDSEEVQIQSEEVPEIYLVEEIHTTCNQANGSVEVEVSGGVMPFQYSIGGSEFQSSDLFENLVAGAYEVVVQDDLGCRDSLFVAINPSAPPLVLPIESQATKCGENNGVIIIQSAGISENAKFSIDGASYQEESTFTELEGGEYTVHIKDENNCISKENIEVADSEIFRISRVDIKKEDCGEDNGSILLAIRGGTEPIDVTLNDNYYLSQYFFEDLNSGNYNLQLQDVEGCRIDTSIRVKSEECPIYIPNIFTPDENGFNDNFEIHTHPDFTGDFKAFRVFDRWGAMLYEIKNFEIEDLDWDGTRNGKVVADGVYVYQLEYLPEEGDVIVHTGDLTIIK